MASIGTEIASIIMVTFLYWCPGRETILYIGSHFDIDPVLILDHLASILGSMIPKLRPGSEKYPQFQYGDSNINTRGMTHDSVLTKDVQHQYWVTYENFSIGTIL